MTNQKASTVTETERLSHIYGGQWHIESGQTVGNKGMRRRFWRICEVTDPDCKTAVVRAQRIENSWALRPNMKASPPRWRRIEDAWVLVYVYRGRGMLWFQTAELEVSQGDLLVIPPGRAHLYGPDKGTSWDEFSFVLRGGVFECWFQPGFLDPDATIRHLLPVDHWLGRLQDAMLPLAGLGRKQGPGDWAAVVAVLAEVCEHAVRPVGIDWRDEWLLAAKKAILDEPLRPALNLSRIAGGMGISTRTLRRRFTRLCGMTPHRMHALRLMNVVKTMLIGGQTLHAIAERLEFASEFNLSRRFKQLTGLTPSAYRSSAHVA